MRSENRLRPRRLAGEAVIAACLLGFAGFLMLDGRGIRAHTYGLVGPRAFPSVVAVLLVVVGLVLLFDALTGRWQGEGVRQHRPQPLAFIAGGLILQIVLIEPFGFIVASSVLFVCVARGFGSRRTLRDLVAALALSIVTYLAFTRLLLLNLPAGALWSGL